MNDSAYYPSPILPKTDPKLLSKLYPSHYKLIHVQIIHRHGHRTPFTDRLPFIFPHSWPLCNNGDRTMIDDYHSIKKSIPFFKFSSEQQPPLLILFNTSLAYPRNTIDPDSISMYRPGRCFQGQLTDKGIEFMQRLGQSLRAIYIDYTKLLPNSWDESSSSMLYLRSTAYSRTINSLKYLMKGLYPTISNPTPYHVNMRLPDSETMYPWLQCAKLKEWMEYYKKAFHDHYSHDIERIKSKLSHLFYQPDPLGTYPSIHGLFDTLYCARENGVMNNDKIISDNDLYELERLSNIKWFSLFAHNTQVSRLGIGRFIKELLSELQANVLGNSDTRMSIYSGHDTTVGPLLGSFGYISDRWPPFGANMAIELILDTRLSSHYVRIKYNDQVITNCLKSMLDESHPDDSTLYPFGSFVSICEKIIPVDLSGECDNKYE